MSYRNLKLSRWQPIGVVAPVKAVNTWRPRQNGRHFPDDISKRTFLNENVRISIKISLKFIPKSPINNIPALVQIMAWRRPDDKPLSVPMMIIFTDSYMRRSASMSQIGNYRKTTSTSHTKSQNLNVSDLVLQLSTEARC